MSGYQRFGADQLSSSEPMDASHGQTRRHPLWLPYLLLLIESSFFPLFMGDLTFFFFKLCPVRQKYRFFIILIWINHSYNIS